MNRILKKKMIRFILNRLNENGHEAYITGGAVRDIMRNRSPRDVDILTSAALSTLPDLFPDQKVKIVGSSFPVCMIGGIEVSSGRGGPGVSDFPESDLAKRDFTLNAMAYDPVHRKIYDPFNGRKDLKNGEIRFTRSPMDRIAEDPVRMVRACRFAAMINGRLSVSSFDAVLSCRHLISRAAAERIQHEIIRAMALETPSLFFKALKETGLLAAILPSLDRCYTLDGGPYHGETVFEHCMLVGDALPAGRPMLRLAGFLHDTGKFDAADIKDGQLSFAGHETRTKAMTEDLKRLRFSGRQIRYIESMTKAHMRPLKPDTTDRAARRLLAMLAEFGLDYRDFMRLRIADKKGNLAKPPYTIGQVRVRLEKLLGIIREKPVLDMNRLKISGNDIIRIMKIAPGPGVGEIKKILLDRVLCDPELNTYEELERICRSIRTSS